jgi:hypothetical protein
VKEARALWDAFWDVNPILPLINWQTIIKELFFCLKVFIGASHYHWKCQDATTTTTTTVVIFSHTKNTQKFPKGEREREKKAPTPNIVLSSCANGVGKSCTKEKYAMVGFFSFHNGCCPFVPPPPKKKNIHNIGFIYLLKFATDIVHLCPPKKQKKIWTRVGERIRP